MTSPEVSSPKGGTIIPLHIYQCWKTKDLPPIMRKVVDSVKEANPEFTHHLFDDAECRQFILRECPRCVLDAYDRLIPGAYKADLWRLCILYKRGGIYMDIKFSPIQGFKFIELTNREHFVTDRLPNTIYNAFIVCKPKSTFLLTCINRIIQNVRGRYYGRTALHPTGPGMMGDVKVMGKYFINEDMVHVRQGGAVMYKGKYVLKTTYNGYHRERQVAGKHYDDLWNQRRIYK